jgi:hypothetical protein
VGKLQGIRLREVVDGISKEEQNTTVEDKQRKFRQMDTLKRDFML